VPSQWIAKEELCPFIGSWSIHDVIGNSEQRIIGSCSIWRLLIHDEVILGVMPTQYETEFSTSRTHRCGQKHLRQSTLEDSCYPHWPPEEMALEDAFSCLESVTFLFVCQVRSWPIVGVWWILHTPYASICIIQLCFGLKANLHWLLQRHSKVRNTGSMVASKHSQWLIQSTRSRVLGGSQHLRPKHLGLLRGRRSSGSHWGAVSVSVA